MMFLANTGKVWRSGQPLSDEAFLSFGDLAAFEADRHSGSTPSSFMTMFSHLILCGVFDGEPPGLIPFVDLMVIDQSLRYMQMPLIGAERDKDTNMPARPPEFLGYGCANSDDILGQLALMHQWFENGPERTTPEELHEFASELLAQEFETYPDVVQGFLNDILIAKEKLQEWYRLRGVIVPWPGASNDNMRTGNSPETAIDLSNGVEQMPNPKLGRPPKSAWVFIRTRSREMKRENRDQLNKVIAAKVLNEAANDFSPDDLPAESTVVKEMGRILNGI